MGSPKGRRRGRAQKAQMVDLCGSSALSLPVSFLWVVQHHDHVCIGPAGCLWGGLGAGDRGLLVGMKLKLS
jgi:hypothetical protein